MRRLGVALVHFPILAKDGSIVTTAITNLDIHDIARSCYTYGVESYTLVHPVAAQRELASRVKEHWTEGSGARRIPDRKPPMECLRIEETLEEARSAFDADAEIWVTSAQEMVQCVEHSDARAQLDGDGPPVLLAFGTGWGLAPEVTERAAVRLSPIRSPRTDGYNHLSVRAAAAILLDRLRGAP
jgi:hypothetical protein